MTRGVAVAGQIRNYERIPRRQVADQRIPPCAGKGKSVQQKQGRALTGQLVVKFDPVDLDRRLPKDRLVVVRAR